jgi:hypothetical protein
VGAGASDGGLQRDDAPGAISVDDTLCVNPCCEEIWSRGIS